jgi:hypothetical protein
MKGSERVSPIRRSGRVFKTALASLGLLAWAPPSVAGQLAIGGQVSATEFVESERTWGYGFRAQVQIPGVGLGVQGTYDTYGEDCLEGNCDLTEKAVNVIWVFPLPIPIHPYVGGGVLSETLEGSGVEVSNEEFRVQVLGGVVLDGPMFQRFRPFGEVKYELEEQRTSFSGGILLYLF